MSKQRIAIFGASKLGKIAYTYLADKHDIVAFIDNDTAKQGSFLFDVPILTLEQCMQKNIDLIMVASDFRTEICTQLHQAGVDNFTQFSIKIDSSYASEYQDVSIIQLPLVDIGDLLSGTPNALNFEHVTFSYGGSGILDYALLKALVEKFNVKTYFEIGTWRGESIAAIASVINQCFSVSLPDEAIAHMDTAGIGRPNTGVSRYFSKNVANITHFLQDSKTFDIANIPKDVDLVFIDGDHSFQGIANDTAKVFSHIDIDNCIVVWHDFKTKDNRFRATTINAINSVIPERLAKNIFGVSNSMCGIYLPEHKRSKLKFGISADEMYSYDVSLKPRIHKLG